MQHDDGAAAANGADMAEAPPEGWLQAYQELQQQISHAHATYQRLMAESHLAFLHAAETTAVGLQSLVTGGPADGAPLPAPPEGVTLPPTPPAPAEPHFPAPPAYRMPAPPAAPAAAPAPAPAPAPAAAPALATAATAPAAPSGPAPHLPGEAPTPDEMRAMLLAVVSEKTGYPEDILEMEMNLESDLGIDSIKRVEILSSLQEKAPYIPEVDATELPNLETLGEVLGLMESYLDGEAPSPDSAPEPAPEPAPDSASAPEPEPAPESDPAPAPEPAKIELERDVAPDAEAGFHVLDATNVEESITSTGLVRLEVHEVPAPASGHNMMDSMGGDLLVVTDDGAGLARILVGKLRQKGLRVDLVTREVPKSARGVIFTGGMRPVLDRHSAIPVNREAFRAANRVADQMTNVGGVFITVQATGGDFGLTGEGGVHAWLGGLAGLARTASKEWSRAKVKAIDIERGSRSSGELAQVLFDELFKGGPEREVGLHEDGTRTTLKDRAAPPRPGPTVLNKKSVVVVSGGARGVTAGCMVELARRHQSRFLLLGRSTVEEEPACCEGLTADAELKKALLQDAVARGQSPKPVELGRLATAVLAGREISATVDGIQAAGGEALYLPVDLRNANALQDALARARHKWGPITGLIHAAGVLSDKRIMDKTQEQFDLVFDTKVQGLRNLLDATADDPIDLLCLFSSVAARHGNLGQCDYAMANEVLNQVALLEAQKRRGECLVRSINWGPWEGGMVTPTLAAHFKKLGVPLISQVAGATYLAEELQSDPGSSVQVMVGGRDMPARR